LRRPLVSTDDALLLSGVVGSTAYGLKTPESDTDYLGMYAAPTVQFHGLHPPVDKRASRVTKNPDTTLHEVGKFAKLALGGNPTVMELLWLHEYETVTDLGAEAVQIREAFLSAPRVRDAYLGYATQQFRKLSDRGDGSFAADLRKNTSKHARHLMRLCYQGLILYCTGQLVIKLPSPQDFRDFGEQVADGDQGLALKLITDYEEQFNSSASVLPDEPDEAKVEEWLRKVRAAHL
jgi:predicted nucleotidyltransferase